jgi:hypothetical protein
MLNNIQKLKLCSYTFKANAFGNENQSGSHRKEIGLIAQEVANILPDAVMKASVKNEEILLLNKDRLLMECIGAVQELKRNQKTAIYIIAMCIVLIISLIVCLIVFIFHCLL